MAENLADRNLDAEERELRGKLLGRLLVAGGMVVALLGILWFFDYLASSDEAPEPTVFNKPVPVPPRKTISQPVKEGTDLPEPPAPAAVPSDQPAPADKPDAVPKANQPEAPPKPEVSAAPATVVPKTAAAPVVPHGRSVQVLTPSPTPTAPAAAIRPASAPVLPAAVVTPAPTAPLAPVATQRAVPAVIETPPTTPSARVVAAQPRTAVGVPEGTAAPGMRIPDEAAVAATPNPVARPLPALVPLPGATMRAFNGYVVQAGVFSTAKAAEELHAKLTLNGIPSTLEARVQVGPFKNRDEAEAAQKKLKALGIDGLMIPPAGTRR